MLSPLIESNKWFGSTMPIKNLKVKKIIKGIKAKKITFLILNLFDMPKKGNKKTINTDKYPYKRINKLFI